MGEKIETPTPEELNAEKEALANAEVKEEEVREGIISEFGFDAEEDSEKIDKLVEKEMKSRKTLSTAIGQKIKYRDNPPPPVETEDEKKAREDKETKEAKEKKDKEGEKTPQEVVKEEFEQRDLGELDYPDELKEEIKRIAEVQKVPIKKVLQDPYILSKIEEHKVAVKAEEASISPTDKTGGKGDFSVDKPPEADMGTEEGRKKWDEYLEWMKTQPGYREEDAGM